ncbi:MAG: TlpA family protein disulfide reductase, partial [Bacteroidetes bacterium]|nr:TlpA family protein disulfide reductase [Bacteroidota bacterium]
YEIMVDVTGTLNEPEVAFEGEGAKVNLFYQQFSKRFLVNDGFDYFYQNLVKENAPDEFATKWKKHMEKQYAIVDSFMETKKPKTPKEFGDYMNSIIKYGAGGKLITYLYHKPQISQLQGTNYIQVQHEYYDFLEDYNLPAIAEMENRAMNDFLFSYMIDREMTGRNAGKQAYVSAYNYAKRNFQGEVRDAAMGHILTEHIKNAKSKEEYEQLKKNVEEYRTIAQEKFVANIDARFNEMGLMIPGFPAPDFTLENLDGKKVSLSDFKGKLVVLDFWGTWCGPCKQQLPYSKKIEEKYKDRDDLVFLFVALERGPKETWKQFVNQNQLPGVHLYSRQDRQLLPYNIVSVPRYMLIDKEGNIYDANASRPSQNMEQQILKALED